MHYRSFWPLEVGGSAGRPQHGLPGPLYVYLFYVPYLDPNSTHIFLLFYLFYTDYLDLYYY